jgi:hypothetical protein
MCDFFYKLESYNFSYKFFLHFSSYKKVTVFENELNPTAIPHGVCRRYSYHACKCRTCWRWNSVNLAMSLPLVLAWILHLIPWYNKFVCACRFWSLVFMQDFSVESKTSGISSLNTSWQDLEARYKSSNEVNMTPRSPRTKPEKMENSRTQSENCRILRDKELHLIRRETDDKGPHAVGGRL